VKGYQIFQQGLRPARKDRRVKAMDVISKERKKMKAIDKARRDLRVVSLLEEMGVPGSGLLCCVFIGVEIK